MYNYPLMLDVRERLIVIVGGGVVAARKARGLIDAGANRVRVVSPEFGPELPEQVERVQERYDRRHLSGARLVFAATNDLPTNEQVVRDARELGILVNRADADDEEPGDFTTPAMFQQDGVIVTVSAGSPALAARIRDELRQRMDPRLAKMAAAMRALRPEIRRRVPDITRRREVFRDLAGEEALSVLNADDMSGLRTWLAHRYDELS